MKHCIPFFLLLCLVCITTAEAENYAVLVCGAIEDSIFQEIRYWNDTFLMWETLFRYGWKDENIYVLFGEGVDFNVANPEYWASQYSFWGITDVTDDSAYYNDIEDVFNELETVMTDDDLLFFWSFGHGDTVVVEDSIYSAIVLMNDELLVDTTLA